MPVPVAPVRVIAVSVLVLARRALVRVGVLMSRGVDVFVDVGVLVTVGVGVLVGMDEVAVAMLVGVPVGVLVSVAMLVRVAVRLGMDVAVAGVDLLVVHDILPRHRTAERKPPAPSTPPAWYGLRPIRSTPVFRTSKVSVHAEPRSTDRSGLAERSPHVGSRRLSASTPGR